MPRIPAPHCPTCGQRMYRTYIRQPGRTANGYTPMGWCCLERHAIQREVCPGNADRCPLNRPPTQSPAAQGQRVPLDHPTGVVDSEHPRPNY